MGFQMAGPQCGWIERKPTGRSACPKPSFMLKGERAVASAGRHGAVLLPLQPAAPWPGEVTSSLWLWHSGGDMEEVDVISDSP